MVRRYHAGPDGHRPAVACGQLPRWQDILFMADLGAWNYGIGFGLAIIGLLMTMGWR